MQNRPNLWVFLLISVLCALLLAATMGLCQGIVGSIFGTITDTSSAVIPGARVTVTNVGTHEVRTATTDNAGNYIITTLMPGTYRVHVSKTGFEDADVADLGLLVKQEREVDATLKVGAGTTTVNVAAATVALDTENASQGEVLTSESVSALPLNGQNFVALTGLAPGATPSPTYASVSGPAAAGVSDAGGRLYSSVSIGGNRQQDMTYTFDGVESKTYWDGNVGLYPPPDAIAEFKVQQGYVSSEFGPPVVVNVITKSGSDTLHGSAFEFLRNDKLNARNFFQTTRPPFRMNQFGGTAGDKFPHTDKHHWFAYYQGLRLARPATILDTVPAPSQLNGDFTDLVPSTNGGGCPYDPGNYTGNCLPTTTSQIIDPLTGQGFATPNVIPAGRINSLEKAMVPLFSPPTQTTGPLGNYYVSRSSTQKDNQFSIRTDHALTRSDNVYARFTYSNSLIMSPGDFALSGSQSPLNVRNLGVGWTHIVTPSLVNMLRVGFNDTQQYAGNPVPFNPVPLGIKNAEDQTGGGCVSPPEITISNSSGFPDNGGNCYSGWDRDISIYDNISWVRGKHNMSFGANITRASHYVADQLYLDGVIYFQGGYSGNNIADFVLGAPNETLFGIGRAAARNNGWWTSFYANDDYQLTSRLKVNVGIRYTNNQVLVPQNGTTYTYFDPKTGENLQPPAEGLPPGVANRANLDFAPRAGFAYKVSANTVIRSSYGIYFVDDPADDLSFDYSSPPTFSTVTSLASAPGSLTATVGTGAATDILPPASTIANIPATGTPGGTISLFTRERDRHTPYIQTWNFTVERVLPWHMLLDVAYGGNKGSHLSKRVDINSAVPLTGTPCGSPPTAGCDPRSIDQRRPYPNWSSIFYSGNYATSNYNALQVQLQKAPTHGLFFTLSYAYEKAMDEDEYGNRDYSWTILKSDYALASYNRTQNLSDALTYNLPFGRSATGIKRALLSSWQIASIDAFISGSPFTPRTGPDYAQIGQQYGFKRPDRVCNGNLPSGQQTLLKWFNTSCFVHPTTPFPHLGNSGYNILIGPGYVQNDVAVIKDFTLHERLALQFRTDVFDLVNRANFNPPTNNLNSATFGRVTSALDPREIQFSLKLKW